MFRDGSWTVPSVIDQNFLLDCTPERIANDRWCPRVVISRKSDERSSLYIANPRIASFDTAREAAEMGRLCGEQWIAKIEQN